MGRVWPRHGHCGRPLNSVVRQHEGSMRTIIASIPVAALLAFSVGTALSDFSHPSTPGIGQFGYSSPAKALAALRLKDGVVISDRGGWTVAEDRKNVIVWSFTPTSHNAHPAGVKRAFVRNDDGSVSVLMSVLCGGPKEACDKLVAEFNQLNDQMRQAIESERGSK